MAHSSTILNQLTALFSRHDFENLAIKHHKGQKFRSFNRWSQFVAMMIAQLSARKSLRDLVTNINAQGRRIYHLGMRQTSRATLARVNENQPYELYKELFFSLLKRCRMYAPQNRFKFKGKLYLLDATTIDLCLAIFPWATFRKTKGAVKLHFGLDTDGYLPAFMDMTTGKGHESQWAKALSLPPGSTVVFDKGFNDYDWYQSLTDRKITFVTRLKRNAVRQDLDKRRGRKAKWIVGDQRIRLKDMSSDLRMVEYVDPETGRFYRFITNSFELKARVIADLYKERWKIGVSSKGHITQSVEVRPRIKDSTLVAWEVPWRETKTVKPSDNIFYKENTQHIRLQRTVNVDVASLHETPVAETVDNVRRQQELTETNPMRRFSPAGYQRWHGVKGYVETGEALDTRQRKLAEEANPITLNGKWVSRYQGGGLGRSTVDRRAAKRAGREGPRLMSIPCVQGEAVV